MAEVIISEIFNLPKSDISLRSGDGVLFKVHRNKLSALSIAFENMFEASYDDNSPVEVSENSQALQDFLRVFYSSLYPHDINEWELSRLLSLDAISRKYEVVTILKTISSILQVR